jgi:hypothetical protein
MIKHFKTYRVHWFANHKYHERFMSVNWITSERVINSIIHAEFGHAATGISVTPYC